MADIVPEGEARLHGLDTVMERTNLGKTQVYKEFESGRLRSVKIGRRRLVSESALNEFITELEHGGAA